MTREPRPPTPVAVRRDNRRTWPVRPSLRVLLVLGILLGGAGCGGERGPEVVVYCAQDQVHAEPLLAEFSRASGIRVRALFDSEAVKTVGLANRLLAERARPRADLYWGNEELRTRQLAAAGVFRASNGWSAFGSRARCLVVHTGRVAPAGAEPGGGRVAAPRSLVELTNAVWKGRLSLALPLFGSTATHFLVLRQQWGDPAWRAWCRALLANQPFLEDGNSPVVRRVGRGAAWIGLTDTDDVRAGQGNGLPVAALPAGPGRLALPNTVGRVRGGPHPAEADRLAAYLLSATVRQRLEAAGALDAASPGEGEDAAGAGPDWPMVLAGLEDGLKALEEVFRR